MATPKTAWPTAAELTAYLTDQGVSTVPSGVTLEYRIEQALNEFYKTIGYNTFLAGTADNYDYSPNLARSLYFNAYFASVTSVTVDGVTLTENQDYWLIKQDSTLPAYGIMFQTIQYGDPWSITVNGSKGWSDEIPYDAWQCVLDLAASYELERVSNTSEGSIKKLKQMDVEIEYAVDASQESQAWYRMRTNALAAAAPYKLIRIS